MPIDQVMEWLRPYRNHRDASIFAVKTYALLLLWVFVAAIPVLLIAPADTAARQEEALWAPTLALSYPVLFLVGMLAIVLLEEVVFRLIPIWAIMKFNAPAEVGLLVVIVFSLVFGLLHGGPVFILVQGVAGLVFSAVMVKCAIGGLRWGFLYAVLFHLGYNLTLTAIAIAGILVSQSLVPPA